MIFFFIRECRFYNKRMPELLETPWVLWFHGNKNNNWGPASYAALATVSTVRELMELRYLINDKVLSSGMFFLMRKRGDAMIYPSWESTENVNGGTWQFCAGTDFCDAFWQVGSLAAGEALMTSPELTKELINGVSIARKGTHSVMKIWTCSPPDSEYMSGSHFTDTELGMFSKEARGIIRRTSMGSGQSGYTSVFFRLNKRAIGKDTTRMSDKVKNGKFISRGVTRSRSYHGRKKNSSTSGRRRNGISRTRSSLPSRRRNNRTDRW